MLLCSGTGCHIGVFVDGALVLSVADTEGLKEAANFSIPPLRFTSAGDTIYAVLFSTNRNKAVGGGRSIPLKQEKQKSSALVSNEINENQNNSTGQYRRQFFHLIYHN